MKAQIVLAASFVPLLAVAGCTSLLDIQKGSGDSCVAMDELSGTRSSTAIDLVVVVDRSSSTRGDTGDKAPDWHNLIFGKTASARTDGSVLKLDKRRIPTPAKIHIGAFDGGRVAWQPEIGLPKLEGGNRVAATFAKDSAACIEQRMKDATTTPSEATGSDVLGAFAEASHQADGSSERRELFVATDGLSTVGCADLRKSKMSDAAFVNRIVQTCGTQGGVPDLSGWNVTFAGIGFPATSANPREGQRRWLINLWSALCGASVGEKGSCDFVPGKPTRHAGGR